ncbi:hypothetical protein [Echinicola soli]|nr:hypothetical protein [Echinicola soli]
MIKRLLRPIVPAFGTRQACLAVDKLAMTLNDMFRILWGKG